MPPTSLCRNMSTRTLERGCIGHKLAFCVRPEKKIDRALPYICLVVIFILSLSGRLIFRKRFQEYIV